ncbi:MAG: sulfate adenylyltransferase subunit CysD [Omnitrophica bacterium]|nr:sulfate adenylyltransferase subunit CysD [Candidatus Omnitrophota bacterium]
MSYLDELESKSVYIIREAYSRFRNIALLWSIGKDSTALLWIVRKAFFGKIPHPVVHIDTSFKFKEIYEFRNRYSREWGLDLIISRNEGALQEGMCPDKAKLECCNALKTEALKITMQERRFKALLLAIRRDEHGIRAKERYFSPRTIDFKWDYRNQPPELWDLYKSNVEKEEHFRIHPMLHWTELDIWKYIEREKIPTASLYFAKDGKRYRSIGCETCCAPVDSSAADIKKIIKELKTTKVSERSGRSQDKESAYTMQKLRSLGYM